MTLRVTTDDQVALRELADAERISMQEGARRAVREHIARGRHRAGVSTATERVVAAHRDALERLAS